MALLAKIRTLGPIKLLARYHDDDASIPGGRWGEGDVCFLEIQTGGKRDGKVCDTCTLHAHPG